ncbi:MAG TPA: hypothetical protein VGE72_14045 [Azospirillum sp.]
MVGPGGAAQFTVKLDAWLKKATGRQDAFCRQFTFELARRIVMRTPVRVGFARGGWQPSLGHPLAANRRGDPTGTATLADIGVTIAGFRAGQKFYLLNSVAYIWRLEHGHSRQAPHGMVRTSIAEAPDIARTVLAALKAGGSAPP